MSKILKKQWVICQKNNLWFLLLIATIDTDVLEAVVSVRPKADGSFMARGEKMLAGRFVDNARRDGWELGTISYALLDGELRAVTSWVEKAIGRGLIFRGGSPISSSAGKGLPKEKFRFRIKPPGASADALVLVYVSDKVWAASSISQRSFGELFLDAYAQAQRHWDWSPSRLIVTVAPLVPAARMGLALIWPESLLWDNASYRLMLNPKLLIGYSSRSIWRVIVHELAHLKRAREPIPPKEETGGHDARFCELLGMVDPIVAKNPVDCIMFRDDVVTEDSSFLAEDTAAQHTSEANEFNRPDNTAALRFVVDTTKSKTIGELWLPAKGGQLRISKHDLQNPEEATKLIRLVGNRVGTLATHVTRKLYGRPGTQTTVMPFFTFVVGFANEQDPAFGDELINALYTVAYGERWSRS